MSKLKVSRKGKTKLATMAREDIQVKNALDKRNVDLARNLGMRLDQIRGEFGIQSNVRKNLRIEFEKKDVVSADEETILGNQPPKTSGVGLDKKDIDVDSGLVENNTFDLAGIGPIVEHKMG
ncbi:hypothetical protein Q3G72_010792 [Acer saccharum]|nr:hypothetical protein Q3G72_010792 [Acer saccharum]